MGESGLALIGIYETICILFISTQVVAGFEITAKHKAPKVVVLAIVDVEFITASITCLMLE